MGPPVAENSSSKVYLVPHSGQRASWRPVMLYPQLGHHTTSFGSCRHAGTTPKKARLASNPPVSTNPPQTRTYSPVRSPPRSRGRAVVQNCRYKTTHRRNDPRAKPTLPPVPSQKQLLGRLTRHRDQIRLFATVAIRMLVATAATSEKSSPSLNPR